MRYKTVNIPADLHARLARWAERNGHTIVWTLTQLINDLGTRGSEAGLKKKNHQDN
jgi:hypothetical protein